MASTDPKNISSQSAMPQWMKTKVNTSNASFEAPFTPASPPAYEDSFFYIRYPNPAALLGVKQTETSAKAEFTVQSKEITVSSVAVKEIKDWSKHTEPCKEVFTEFPAVKTSAAESITSKPKPAGVDDGFKGDGAACGSSIIKVAHQMIADQKVTPRGYTDATRSSITDSEGSSSSAQTYDIGEEVNLGRYNLSARRSSKSLPTSPSGSPTSRRKTRNMPANRYFAGTYEVPPDIASSRSWIMAALLGQKKDYSYASTSTINEEEAEHRLTGNMSLAASVDHLGPKPTQRPAGAEDPTISIQIVDNQPQRPQVFRAKPTELREINFWSPTSM